MDNKTRKIITISAIVIIIAIALWLIFKKPKEKNTGSQVPDTTRFPLKLTNPYTTGKAIENVQKYLNSKYKAGLTVDGVWGPDTNSAVIEYLKRDNISDDIYYKWGLDKL